MKLAILIFCLIASAQMIAIPSQVKSAMSAVWKEVQPDVKTFGACMGKAAGKAAQGALKAVLPANAGAFLSMMGVRRLSIFGAIKSVAKKAAGAAKGLACKVGGAKAESACESAVKAGVGKAVSFAQSKVKSINVALAKPCFVTLGSSLCKKAEKKACGRRRMVAIPAAVKKAMAGVWGAIKGDVKTFGACMAKAAGKAAKGALKSVLPANAGAFLNMMGVRRLSIFGAIKSVAKKAAGAAKGLACKVGGAKAESACESAVKAGVGKAVSFAQSKVKSINVALAKPCFVTLGSALCKTAEKKACGRRRMIAIPAEVKNAMASVWGAIQGDVKTFGACMAKAAGKAAKGALKDFLPPNAGAFLSMIGARRLSIFSAIGNVAKKAASAAKGLACKVGGAKAESACESAVKAGASKAVSLAQSHVKSINVGLAKPCFVTLGSALCKTAEKKACGRRF